MSKLIAAVLLHRLHLNLCLFVFFTYLISSFCFPGGPTKCGDQDLPKNFTCTKGSEITGRVTFCGKPRANLSWMIGDQSINGSIDSTKANQHQYTYSFKQDMCGKNVSYRATGFPNNFVNGSTLILIDESDNGNFLF